MLNVLLPDGTAKEFPSAVTVGEVAASIGPGLAKAAVAGEVEGAVGPCADGGTGAESGRC